MKLTHPPQFLKQNKKYFFEKIFAQIIICKRDGKEIT